MKNLNNHFRVVFTPKDPEIYGKRRFAIGIYSLYKYIGRDNANKSILRALKSKTDKCIVKLRSFGTVEFYSK